MNTSYQEMDEMIKNKVIYECDGPWASPVVLVKKPDKVSWRFCVDYRHLNFLTKKDAYPLPNITDSLDALDGAVYFCTLDLASFYWQIEMEEGDKEKTGFATHMGLFAFSGRNCPMEYEAFPHSGIYTTTNNKRERKAFVSL